MTGLIADNGLGGASVHFNFRSVITGPATVNREKLTCPQKILTEDDDGQNSGVRLQVTLYDALEKCRNIMALFII